jgi:radical SAM superfamily enzyme YgiQ (UPF0313 family)
VDSLLFEDDNFFVNAKFAREFAQALIDAKLDLKWETSAHAHIFTKAYTTDDVRLFAQSGCRQIYIGAESGDQEVLNLLDKHLEIQETMRFVEMLCEQGITPRLTTMVCLPTDSGRDLDMTVNLLCRVKLMEHSVRASIFYYTPYPGTRLYQRAKEKGFVPLSGWTPGAITLCESSGLPGRQKESIGNWNILRIFVSRLRTPGFIVWSAHAEFAQSFFSSINCSILSRACASK